MYDPKSDRQPTADEAADAEMALEEREVENASAAGKVQPKNTELAALEQTVQKSVKQGTACAYLSVCVFISLLSAFSSIF